MNVTAHASERDKRHDLTLVLGGTRSGKSAYAEKWVQSQEKRLCPGTAANVLYVATAEARPEDATLCDRIRQHQERRPAHWQTLECSSHLVYTLSRRLFQDSGCQKDAHAPPDIVLLDCVTLWVSNMLFSLPDPEDRQAFEKTLSSEITAFVELVARSTCRWILVSGEIGLGGIASDALSRQYHDGLGLANQILAQSAHEVVLVIAGRALVLPAPEW